MSGMCRIGNCSGYYGDRFSAMQEMLEGGELDYLTGDYLAELTMLILGRDQMKDPSLGYAKTFVRQMNDCMALVKQKNVKIVVNAGGLNPAGCAVKLREIADEQGLCVSIAHVEGDNLLDRSAELGFGEVLTANAYLGAFGIAAALDAGADIVVTGRVTDASVIVGPAIAHFGWQRDDLDELAGAVVAGHVIECGTQATGGNFAGFLTMPARTGEPLGFPIAEIAGDGSSVITKHEHTSGAVTTDTVTAQLVYEIAGPVYLNPDVSTRLDSIELRGDGPDRVAISDVRGEAPPATTKVCLNALGGHRNDVEFVLTGLDIEEKRDWIVAQLESSLQASENGPDSIEWSLDRTDVPDPSTQSAATSVLRCHVKSSSAESVGRTFSNAAVQLALGSYPGFTMTRPPAAGVAYGLYRAAYVVQTEVPHTVVMGDGTRFEISAPHNTAEVNPPAPRTPVRPRELGETTRAPLGRLAYARSGDKGGDANVGLWIPEDHPARDQAFAWLVEFLNVETVRLLVPEAKGLDIEVHPLPNLQAVNIVIHGLLGEGVASSTRFDPQAKALGEWVRARFVDIPTGLLGESGTRLDQHGRAMTKGEDPV